MMVLAERVRAEAPAEPRARAELEAILEGIAEERGLGVALAAAGALREAILEGRVDGRGYVACTCDDPECDEKGVCVVGHLAAYLDSYSDPYRDVPELPGWDFHVGTPSPIEVYVEMVRVGETPESSPVLAEVAGWLCSWRGRRAWEKSR